MLSILLAVAFVSAPLMAQGVQQRFDAARVKLDADDAAGALAELQALETFLKSASKPNQTNLAITRAQQGEVLLRLGRAAEAKAAVRAALADDALAKPALKPVRDNARLILAGLMEGELDHREAAAEYLKVAETSDQPMTRTVALIGAARAHMFTEPAMALAHIDAALALAEANESVGKKELANVLGVKGRILLNAGRDAEARDLLVRAVGLRGGLGQKVFQADVSLRADAAIAMLRLGKAEDARRYLAYSGAGRTEIQLDPPTEMPLPTCGEDGLEPQDTAVIEFTILDDGRVVSPRPIYASKNGVMAYVFAREIERWSWDPDNAAKVKPFFRLATRVELRCSNKMPRPTPTVEFEAESEKWFDGQGVTPLTGASDAARAVEYASRLQTAPADSPARLALLLSMMQNSVLERRDRIRHGAEAIRLADRLAAPAAVKFVVAVVHALAEAEELSENWRARSARLVQLYGELRQRPAFAQPAMQAALDLHMAGALGVLRRPEEEIAALERTARSEGLTPRHPLKVAALVQLANIYAARKQTAKAESMYNLTGLTAKQCALVNGGPVMMRSGSGQFPMEAFAWGFEGWTSLEYDVAADGSTRNSRAVAAFPPRVFAEASEKLARTVRYRVSYRPEGDLACTAMSRRVRFAIP